VPHRVPPIEDIDLEDDNEFHTLRNDGEDREGEGDDSDSDSDAITMDCGSFAMELAFENLKLHDKIYDARATQEGVYGILNGDARHNRREKKKEVASGVGHGASAAIHEREN
jgi:hypothetical protein